VPLERSDKMYDHEKMFHIGTIMLAIAFIMVAVLQISFRLQERERTRTRAEIVRTQQDIAQRQIVLSGLISPENLRGITTGVFPGFQTIGFGRNINVNDIPIRGQ